LEPKKAPHTRATAKPIANPLADWLDAPLMRPTFSELSLDVSFMNLNKPSDIMAMATPAKFRLG